MAICDFGKIIRCWERLRLTYNAALIVLVLCITFSVRSDLIGVPSYWLSVTFGALIANVCFFLGPAFEGYGTYLRFWHPLHTSMLFLAGTGLAALLAIGSMMTF